MRIQVIAGNADFAETGNVVHLSAVQLGHVDTSSVHQKEVCGAVDADVKIWRVYLTVLVGDRRALVVVQIVHDLTLNASGVRAVGVRLAVHDVRGVLNANILNQCVSSLTSAANVVVVHISRAKRDFRLGADVVRRVVAGGAIVAREGCWVDKVAVRNRRNGAGVVSQNVVRVALDAGVRICSVCLAVVDRLGETGVVFEVKAECAVRTSVSVGDVSIAVRDAHSGTFVVVQIVVGLTSFTEQL